MVGYFFRARRLFLAARRLFLLTTRAPLLGMVVLNQKKTYRVSAKKSFPILQEPVIFSFHRITK